eukprot:scaffold2927_cov184-Alexandrium_tamarense.AAC.9
MASKHISPGICSRYVSKSAKQALRQKCVKCMRSKCFSFNVAPDKIVPIREREGRQRNLPITGCWVRHHEETVDCVVIEGDGRCLMRRPFVRCLPYKQLVLNCVYPLFSDKIRGSWRREGVVAK